MYPCYLLLKTKTKKHRKQREEYFKSIWIVHKYFLINGVKTYFTDWLRQKRYILNSLSNIIEDLNAKSILLTSSESKKDFFEAFAICRWKTPLTFSCVNREKISNCSQPCQSIMFFGFETLRYKNHHVSRT